MLDQIRIGLDLDGVIADKPFFIPREVLEWLFRGGGKDSLHCCFPKSRLDQKIRKISHFYAFRPPIKKTIMFLNKIAPDKRFELYLISARYSFLINETEIWLKKRGIDKIFKKVFSNSENQLPHLFKKKVLEKLKPDIYVEDDSAILGFLKSRIPTISYFHFRKELGDKLEELLKFK